MPHKSYRITCICCCFDVEPIFPALYVYLKLSFTTGWFLSYNTSKPMPKLIVRLILLPSVQSFPHTGLPVVCGLSHLVCVCCYFLFLAAVNNPDWATEKPESSWSCFGEWSKHDIWEMVETLILTCQSVIWHYILEWLYGKLPCILNQHWW